MIPKLEKVHEDVRGEIYSILLPGDRELMLFHCKAGYLRGGHSHDVPEIVLVLAGRLVYHKMVGGQKTEFPINAGGQVMNLPGEPHMARFLEDSWVLEWKINTSIGQWATTDYPPFRALVERSMT